MGAETSDSPAQPPGEGRVYFARAVDGLDRAQVIAAGERIADCLKQHGLRLVDPVAAWSQPGARAGDIVRSDLSYLRKSDAVLMDLSIIGHQYVGCISELTYAYLWDIPSFVWVGGSGLERRSWLRHHATVVAREKSDAIASLVASFRHRHRR